MYINTYVLTDLGKYTHTHTDTYKQYTNTDT